MPNAPDSTTPPNGAPADPKPAASAPAPGKLAIHLDGDTRLITLTYRRPLDVRPATMDLPFAIVLQLAAQIMLNDAGHELQAASGGSAIVRPH